jgi:hypothetical protein
MSGYASIARACSSNPRNGAPASESRITCPIAAQRFGVRGSVLPAAPGGEPSLGSSEEARALSPFVDETGGGEDLEPERQWATELGINQSLPSGVRLDVSYWRRRVHDVSDPNVLFGTTLIVPNAIARGEADGVDVRLDFPRSAVCPAMSAIRTRS